MGKKRFTKTDEKVRFHLGSNSKICPDAVDEILKIDEMIKSLQTPYLQGESGVFSGCQAHKLVLV